MEIFSENHPSSTGSKLYFFNLDLDGSLIKSSLPVIVYPFNFSAIARLCIAEPPIAIK